MNQPSHNAAPLSLFITCAKGLESLLEQEVRDCGGQHVRQSVAGVSCQADLGTAYRLIMFSRLSNRVILLLAEAPVQDADDLYRCADSVDWPHHLSPSQTLSVSAAGSTEQLNHTQFIAQRVKDAVVDQFRRKGLPRPSVSREAPDLLIHAVIRKNRLSLGIDLSGASLHRRHYRIEQGDAPLKETLAAALLMRAGWPQTAIAEPCLMDPMCGAGTLLIEGVLMALDIAPGLVRDSGLTAWPHHDAAQWQAVVEEAKTRRRKAADWKGCVIGADADDQVIGFARRNAERAGVGTFIRWQVAALASNTPDKAPSLVICNPPYAERLGEQAEVELLYKALGEWLRQHAMGATVAVFTAKPEWGKLLGIHSHKQYALYNGALPAKLLLMQINEDTVYRRKAAGDKASPAEPRPLDPGTQMFANRLRKNLRTLGKWAAQQGLECYRLYDADMPEYAFAIDCYGKHIHMQEYRAPASVSEEDAAQRRRQAYEALCLVMQESLQIPPSHITLKVRERQKGKEQYRPSEKAGEDFEVHEGKARFVVNLERYLDTGLFLDHRPVRQWIYEHSRDCRFLNLFCYTATATVHAALGGAKSSTSVDLSRTYLQWSARNFALNGVDPYQHKLVQSDCLEFLQGCRQEFDLIFLDPPTFSNSKSTENVLDIQRDHVRYIELCMARLAPGGLLIFSNNHRRFRLDDTLMERYQVEDRSAASIDKDFARNTRIHRTWFIRPRS
ncbi:MAG: bifunctional 23S rRNA (guanine(2069)-N(7))-methyltransferase RlmK/23S rRNA (guanine(2445)-N(2))-methyltransferase RlmL [Pseudomonadales bacterium]|nr:bifunctional 23S rRNA (guanine(2069)-N(7))-methyltransferase RlmK/23S rRNA (guanine(2445)-N(2))-methyltransferase RlmL [Pseudomonadales bacterium]